MAIAYDTFASVSGGGVSSVTIPTFATTGSDRFVFYGVAILGWQINVNSIVRGGAETATQKWSQRAAGDNSTSYGGHYVAPAEATATVVVTLSGSATDVIAGALCLNGVHQTTPTGASGTATGTGTTATVTVAADDTDWLVDSVTNTNWRAMVVGADQEARFNFYDGSNLSQGISTQPGTADDVMSWALTDSVSWVTGAVPIKPSVSAAPVVVSPVMAAQQRMG